MDKKEQYAEQALKMFFKNGIKNVTIGHIAQELNISTKTIYKLFEDKTGLVLVALDKDRKMIAQTYQSILQTPNAIEALMLFYQALLHRVSKLNPLYFEDIRKVYPIAWQEGKQLNLDQIQKLVQKGVDSRVFYAQIDIQLSAQTIILLLDFVLEQNLSTTQPLDRQKLIFHIFYPYLKGICTQKGLDEMKELLEITQTLK